jgi:hypothetical protein
LYSPFPESLSSCHRLARSADSRAEAAGVYPDVHSAEEFSFEVDAAEAT